MAPARPHPARRPLRLLLLLAAGLLLWGLFSLPYDVLRAERIRAFGEIETRGEVVAKEVLEGSGGEPVHVIRYAYLDESGLMRQARAPFPRKTWERLRVGDRIPVFFARVNAAVVRARGQIEPPFQTWLRSLLGTQGKRLPFP